jgi:hypothetical protein
MTVYGKYSLGTGVFLDNPDHVYQDLDSFSVIEGYQKSMKLDLQKAGISLESLHHSHVMDVGTGRQALVFEKLGARNVNHYDFSPQNVENLSRYIETHSLSKRIQTQYSDLVEDVLPEEKFELIYLQGIVQHFSHTGIGLKNCIQALKKKGHLWLYFYRSGTWPMFLKFMIRDLLEGQSNMDEYYLHSVLNHSDDALPNFRVSSNMDNFFASHMHLYEANTYVDFIQQCGLEIQSSSRLDPYGKAVDHEHAYQAAVITCRKVNSVDLHHISVDSLSPEQSVDQLAEHHYSSPVIIESIQTYQALKALLIQKKMPRSVYLSLSFFLDKQLFQAGQHYKVNQSYPTDAHHQLQTSLKRIYQMIEKT